MRLLYYVHIFRQYFDHYTQGYNDKMWTEYEHKQKFVPDEVSEDPDASMHNETARFGYDRARAYAEFCVNLLAEAQKKFPNIEITQTCSSRSRSHRRKHVTYR